MTDGLPSPDPALQQRLLKPPSAEPTGYFAAPNHPRLQRLASRLSFRVRRQMYERFAETTKPAPSTRVLDVGVTPDVSHPELNYFEQLYPYTAQVTATSVEDASNLEDCFPGLTFVQTSGVTLPFADGQFDVAFSSAVIEHVGDEEHQRIFLAELMRVADLVYVLTPNRWFPIDLHTMLPIIHWLPRPIHQFLLRTLGLDFWAATDNLNLLSRRRLRSLFPASIHVRITSHSTFGLPSNLVVCATKGHPPAH